MTKKRPRRPFYQKNHKIILSNSRVTSLVNFYPWVKGKYKKSILYLKGGDVLEEISELCRKFGLLASQITAWPISNWLSDDYFAEKFVIEIRK